MHHVFKSISLFLRRGSLLRSFLSFFIYLFCFWRLWLIDGGFDFRWLFKSLGFIFRFCLWELNFLLAVWGILICLTALLNLNMLLRSYLVIIFSSISFKFSIRVRKLRFSICFLVSCWILLTMFWSFSCFWFVKNNCWFNFWIVI